MEGPGNPNDTIKFGRHSIRVERQAGPKPFDPETDGKPKPLVNNEPSAVQQYIARRNEKANDPDDLNKRQHNQH